MAANGFVVVTNWSEGPTVTFADALLRRKTQLALLAYMQQHKIGTPRLARRITESVPRNPKIPVKTLQRFLAGNMRTSDMYVGFFSAFAEQNVTRDPVTELGLSLSQFYRAGSDCNYTGTYLRRNNEDGQLTFVIDADKGFWRVSVTPQTQGEDHFVKDGVLVDADGAVLMVLKDALSGSPASYAFILSGEHLVGSGVSVSFLAGAPDEFLPRSINFSGSLILEKVAPDVI